MPILSRKKKERFKKAVCIIQPNKENGNDKNVHINIVLLKGNNNRGFNHIVGQNQRFEQFMMDSGNFIDPNLRGDHWAPKAHEDPNKEKTKYKDELLKKLKEEKDSKAKLEIEKKIIENDLEMQKNEVMKLKREIWKDTTECKSIQKERIKKNKDIYSQMLSNGCTHVVSQEHEVEEKGKKIKYLEVNPVYTLYNKKNEPKRWKIILSQDYVLIEGKRYLYPITMIPISDRDILTEVNNKTIYPFGRMSSTSKQEEHKLYYA